MSANTISPPQYLMQLADAAKVIGVVMTLSPALTLSANAQQGHAAETLVIPTAYFEPV